MCKGKGLKKIMSGTSIRWAKRRTSYYGKQITDMQKIRPKEKLYIALSELDFSWYRGEVEYVKEAWGDNLHITDIAEELHRDVDEVALLVMDLARNDCIEHRGNGVFGDNV